MGLVFCRGFSGALDGERDLDTVLRQYREALKKAGIEAPYIPCPHSVSQIEAIPDIDIYRFKCSTYQAK